MDCSTKPAPHSLAQYNTSPPTYTIGYNLRHLANTNDNLGLCCAKFRVIVGTLNWVVEVVGKGGTVGKTKIKAKS